MAEAISEAELLKRRRKTIDRLLKNWQNWSSLVESEGLFTITVHGEEFHHMDMLEGLNSLPPRQRQAVFYMCVMDKSEQETAQIMGFDNPMVSPVPQYRQAGIVRLIEYLDADPEEQAAMIQRVSRYGHTVRKKRKKADKTIAPDQEEVI